MMTLSLRQRPVFCRVAAVLCALAMLLAVAGHHFQHANTSPSMALSQLESAAADDAPDVPLGAAFSVEHCHGCGLTALAVTSIPVLPAALPDAQPGILPASACPHPPGAELPPPIAAV